MFQVEVVGPNTSAIEQNETIALGREGGGHDRRVARLEVHDTLSAGRLQDANAPVAVAGEEHALARRRNQRRDGCPVAVEALRVRKLDGGVAAAPVSKPRGHGAVVGAGEDRRSPQERRDRRHAASGIQQIGARDPRGRGNVARVPQRRATRFVDHVHDRPRLGDQDVVGRRANFRRNHTSMHGQRNLAGEFVVAAADVADHHGVALAHRGEEVAGTHGDVVEAAHRAAHRGRKHDIDGRTRRLASERTVGSPLHNRAVHHQRGSGCEGGGLLR
jgi:hypothetical protein